MQSKLSYRLALKIPFAGLQGPLHQLVATRCRPDCLFAQKGKQADETRREAWPQRRTVQIDDVESVGHAPSMETWHPAEAMRSCCARARTVVAGWQL